MGGELKPPETLAERFWSLARGMEGTSDSTEPVAVVEHVLAVLDALDAGKVGRDLTTSTVNFLTLLRQQEVRGDLLYASPEQARGEVVDERSLVFSVGVLLFEKLTGRHPFGADGNPQRLARIQRGEMASGVNYFPRVPAELRAVLLKAMGPFPEERWRSLADLRAHLHAFVGYARAPGNRGGPLRSRPLPALPGESLAPPIARRRAASPSIELPRMATMSGRHSAVRAEDVPAEEAPPPAEVAPRAPATAARLRLPPGAWAFAGVLAGAAVTSFVFLAAWPDRPAAPALATMDTATQQQAGLAAKAPMPTTELASTAPAPPPSAPATIPVATHAPVAVEAPSAPRTFDPSTGGEIALAAVRTCVAADRKAQFGASLHYDAGSGLSRRVYFGAAQQLQRPERDCMEEKLVGLSAGAAPDQPAIVTYSFHLSPAGDHVKARLKPAP